MSKEVNVVLVWLSFDSPPQTLRVRSISIPQDMSYIALHDAIYRHLDVIGLRIYYKDENSEIEIKSDSDLKDRLYSQSKAQQHNATRRPSSEALVIFVQGFTKTKPQRSASTTRIQLRLPTETIISNQNQLEPPGSGNSSSRGLLSPPNSAKTTRSRSESRYSLSARSFSSSTSSSLTLSSSVKKPKQKPVLDTSKIDLLAVAVHPKSFTTLYAKVVERQTFDPKSHTREPNPLDVSNGKYFTEQTVERFLSFKKNLEKKRQEKEKEKLLEYDLTERTKKMSLEQIENSVKRQHEAHKILEQKKLEKQKSFLENQIKNSKKIVKKEVIDDFVQRMERDAQKKQGNVGSQTKTPRVSVDSVIHSPKSSRLSRPASAPSLPIPKKEKRRVVESNPSPADETFEFPPLNCEAVEQIPQRKKPMTVELCFNCTGLLQDSKLPSSWILAVYNHTAQSYSEIGRTELNKSSSDDDDNDGVVTSICVPFIFEKLQKMRICLYHKHDGDTSSDLSRLELFGFADFVLGEVVGHPSKSISCPFKDSSGVRRESSTVQISVHQKIAKAKETRAPKEEEHARVQVRGKGFSEQSDWRLRIFRGTHQIHKSEIVSNSNDPIFSPFEISLELLCCGSVSTELTVECWNAAAVGDVLFGSCKILFGDLLLPRASAFGFALTNESGSPVGILTFSIDMFMKSVPPPFVPGQHSFVEYLNDGWELSCVVAIDFTASNGDPASSTSLHYCEGTSPNEYEAAITSVGSILECYDQDKRYPVFGFGGSQYGSTSHCFALNGSNKTPHCQGVSGILEAYRSSLQQNELSAPTNFQEIIEMSQEYAREAKQSNQKRYFVLLILTDGEISDMAQTKDAIIQASELPMSIIIVGVGAADFSSMRELDSNEKMLSNEKGQSAVRDIVQFVPFRDFKSLPPEKLAESTLSAIPNQLLDYVDRCEISPSSSE